MTGVSARNFSSFHCHFMTKTKNGFDPIEEENFNILAKNAEHSNDLVGESSNYDDISNFHDRVKAV